jgi:hypothetical protein
LSSLRSAGTSRRGTRLGRFWGVKGNRFTASQRENAHRPPRCGLPVAACPGKDFLPVEFDTEAPRCEALAVEREKRRLVSEAKVK